ncbi:MAG: hypothetical protein K0Q72_693 [Armatimonadetes bacterium]|nr:hypothetical protein [Armatimonadota bacterium]
MLGGYASPNTLRATLTLTRTSAVRLYAQGSFGDKMQPSVIGLNIKVNGTRIATSNGVADHGVLHQLNTQRTLTLAPGTYTVQVQVFGQFGSTMLRGDGVDDMTYLNIEVL